MFGYQLHTATINLMDPPTVLSQHERDITDDNIPLITICPTNQTNPTRIEKLGYIYGYDYMLMGIAKCNETTECISWGSHLNLTFEELKDQVFDLNKVESINIWQGGECKDSLVFIPAYGVCRETSFLNHTQEIALNYTDEVRVFITDRNYRSLLMPDVASQVGKEIFMKPEREHFINVNIKER